MSDPRIGLDAQRAADLRARNRRTGLILASIALVFFVGILIRYSLH